MCSCYWRRGITRYWCSREPSFAKEGLKVYVAGRTFQKIEAVAAEIHANAGEAVAFRLDAEDIHQVQALFDTITSQNERISVVIHNVGGIFLPSFYAAHCRFLLKCGNPLFYRPI